MQQSYIIGVDIGTGSTKAVAMNTAGEVLHNAQRFYPSIVDGEKAEQDVGAVWEAFAQCVREIVEEAKELPAAVSLSSAMHSVMAVGEKGESLTNAILWSDTRSTDIARALRGTSLGKEIYLATGTPLHSMSPLCKLKWFQLHEPTLFAKATKFISIKEYIWFRLFGEYVIDHSLASATGLFNIHHLQWERTALEYAGVNLQQLSQPVPVTYTRNTMHPSVAAQLGLPPDTPFFIGGSDGCMANLGSLCLSPDEAAVTIGTSGAVRITNAKPVQQADQMIFNYRLNEETFVCGGAINNGGNVFQWLLKRLFAHHESIRTYEELFRAIAAVPPGSDGLLFLPYLHGERAPIWDERSSGVFIGVTSMHTLNHFAKAAAEGVCFALYHVLTSLEEACGTVQQLTISGGLIHIASMMQLIADVMGKKVIVQQNDDASAMGAVYLAQKALGLLNDFSAIPKNEERVFLPEAEAAAHYQKMFAHYKVIYPLLAEQLHSLHQLRQ